MHDFGIYLELEPDEEEKANARAKHTNGYYNKEV